MQARSENWIKMTSRGRFSLGIKAEIDGVDYTAISAPNIDRTAMTDPLSVGSCLSSSLKFSVMTDSSIAKGAQIVIKARVTEDGKSFSEWKEFGTFFISKRTINNGIVSLEGFDAMIKASQMYVDPTKTDDRIGWPKSHKVCVDEIAKRIGVVLDSRTTLKTGTSYQVEYPENYTMSQVLGFIGACNGGNWIITPENKLRLIPIVPLSTETFDIVDYDYSNIFSNEGYKLIYKSYTEKTVVNSAGGSLINVPVVLDKITTGKSQIISRVTITRDDATEYTRGDDTGAELRISENPCASQTVCDDLYATLKGLVYAPFSATKTCFDPCAELGDWVIIGDKVRSVIYKQSINFGVDFRADIEAPEKDETEDEFPYLGEADRLKSKAEELRKYVDAVQSDINSKIEQTHSSILLAVSGTYATQENVNSSVELLENKINLKVSKDDVESAIEQSAESIRLKASKISWESDHSSLSEDGVLEATGVKIRGEITATSGSFTGEIKAISGIVGGWNIGSELFFRKEDDEDDYEIGLNPQALINVFYINDIDDKGNKKNIFSITRKGAITMNNNLLCTGVYASGAVVAKEYVSSTEARAQRFFLIDDNGNTVGDDIQTQIDASSFAPGNVVTVPVNTSFSGYVPYGKRGIHFLIPLSKPVIKKVKTVTLSGSVLFRGINGALNGGNNISFENEKDATTIEIINGVGLKVMINFASEITNAVNNDVVSVGTRTALTISFA